jgi:peroxiredoxin Q/BCP
VQPDGPAVVYFYPEDLTPGCTMEAKGFNDRYARFREAGYEVIGVSLDSDERHDEFRQECGLDFPLVADTGAALTTELGLLKDYGEYGVLPRRVTFLLDADGVVERVWDVKDAAAHPEEVLAIVLSHDG